MEAMPGRTANQRHVSPLEGAFNFRDLGGLPVGGGHHLRHGLLFRSDTLQALTAADVNVMVQSLGMRVIVDLRLPEEVAAEGRGLLAGEAGIAFVNTPMGMASTEGLQPEEVLPELYRQCLASPSMVEAIAQIASHAGQPTVFHCAAGKDRTGLVAAMLLSLAGADDDTIVADYMASASNMPRMVARFNTWPRYRDHLATMPAQVYGVDERPIRIFLDELNARHGGAWAWSSRRGLDRPALEHLVQTLRD